MIAGENADAAIEKDTDDCVTRFASMSILCFFIERQQKITAATSSYITVLESEFRKEKLILFGYFEYAGQFKIFLMSVAFPDKSDIHVAAFDEKDNDSSNTQTLLETFFSSDESASQSSKIGSSLYRIPITSGKPFDCFVVLGNLLFRKK